MTIAVLDSGIKWNDHGAMLDMRLKTRINRGETPRAAGRPRHAAREPARTAPPTRAQCDVNGDGVFNLVDYACDSRVERDPAQRGGLGVDRPTCSTRRTC